MILRRDFLQAAELCLPIAFSSLAKELHADIVILSGVRCFAALVALESGCRVILVEETEWMGRQLTQQGLPPDEHPWIEQFGATRSYRDFRQPVQVLP